MTAVLKTEYISVADYMDEEELSPTRHEFVNGVAYAMAGTSREHETIGTNLLATLHSHLRGGPWHVFMSNFRVHPATDDNEIFYYPDVMVSCDPRDEHRYFNRYPKALIEILSESTERTDRIEKVNVYTKIETLDEYVIVAQAKMMVTVFRKANHWEPEVLTEAAQELRLPSISFATPLAEIYRDVRFA